jgi:hypothetical protein
MDKYKEIVKIQNELKIPVTDINIFPFYVEIISGKEKIGSIPYYTVAGINTYDTNNNIVNWLKWEKIYKQHSVEIHKKIADLINDNNIIISLGTFRSLYAKKSNSELICTITCSYLTDGWSVEKNPI